MDLTRHPPHGGNLLCRLGAFPLLQCYFHYRHSVCTLDSPPRSQRVCGAVELQALSIRPARIRFPPLTYAGAYC